MNIAQSLAESVKARGAKLAYGEPVEADGATIIPVAMVSYGFGGGGDQSDNGGGGGGGLSLPIGIYEIRDGETRFRPNWVTAAVLSVPLVAALGIAVSRILKALR
jgi:uncharacterized spore protein YtfJ